MIKMEMKFNLFLNSLTGKCIKFLSNLMLKQFYLLREYQEITVLFLGKQKDQRMFFKR